MKRPFHPKFINDLSFIDPDGKSDPIHLQNRYSCVPLHYGAEQVLGHPVHVDKVHEKAAADFAEYEEEALSSNIA